MTHFNLNFTQGKQRGNLKKKKKSKAGKKADELEDDMMPF